MITSPRPNLYVSDKGFSVEVLGRTGLRYCEGQKAMFVDSEVLTGPSGMMVYKSSIARWDAPYTGISIDDQERTRIANNIREAFRAQGFEIDMV
jgi:hypothetical protein